MSLYGSYDMSKNRDATDRPGAVITAVSGREANCYRAFAYAWNAAEFTSSVLHGCATPAKAVEEPEDWTSVASVAQVSKYYAQIPTVLDRQGPGGGQDMRARPCGTHEHEGTRCG
jgi:hypothetical protein